MGTCDQVAGVPKTKKQEDKNKDPQAGPARGFIPRASVTPRGKRNQNISSPRHVGIFPLLTVTMAASETLLVALPKGQEDTASLLPPPYGFLSDAMDLSYGLVK